MMAASLLTIGHASADTEYKCHVQLKNGTEKIQFVEATNAAAAANRLLEKPSKTKHGARQEVAKVLECQPMSGSFSSSTAQTLDAATTH
jgi:hypothetical protein